MDEPRRPNLRAVPPLEEAAEDVVESQAQVVDAQDAMMTPYAPAPMAALPLSAHFRDLLWSAGVGALIGVVAKQEWTGAAIGALAGAAVAATEKAVFGERVLVDRRTQMSMIAVGLGATVGAGYLSWRWR